MSYIELRIDIARTMSYFWSLSAKSLLTMTLPANLLQTRNETVGLLAMLYSPQGLQMFAEMADDSYKVAWQELTAEEARSLLYLLNVSEQIGTVASRDLNSLGLMPVTVLKGLTSAEKRLAPYRNVLTAIEAGQLSPLEAKVQAGEIAVVQGKGVVLSTDELTNLLADAA